MARILTDGGRWEKEITEKRYGRWLIPFFVSQRSSSARLLPEGRKKAQKGLRMSGNGHTENTENTDFNWSLPIELRSTSNATRQYSSKLDTALAAPSVQN